MDLFYFNHLLLDQEILGFSPSLCVIGDMFKYENRINHYVVCNISHVLLKYLATHYKLINNGCKGDLYTTILNICQITN